jgi:hypothetical protein
MITSQCRIPPYKGIQNGVNISPSRHVFIHREYSVGSEIITVVIMKVSVFWDTTQYSPLKSTNLSEENIASMITVEELVMQEISVK